ncbi:hypothetical protein J6590_009245 [Homalodisca vitripennis]|nr:hypothetical protein J6590_009245 [Homalodisca vitripennis]
MPRSKPAFKKRVFKGNQHNPPTSPRPSFSGSSNNRGTNTPNVDRPRPQSASSKKERVERLCVEADSSSTCGSPPTARLIHARPFICRALPHSSDETRRPASVCPVARVWSGQWSQLIYSTSVSSLALLVQPVSGVCMAPAALAG